MYQQLIIDGQWEDDRKQYVTAFNKKTLETIPGRPSPVPVFCSTSRRRVPTLPNSILVNVKTKKVAHVPSTYPIKPDESLVPLCYAYPGAISDMSALKRQKRPYAAIVFVNAEETDVENMFEFYSEIEGVKPTPKIIRALAKCQPLNANHPWVLLGRIVEAGLFLNAAITTVDTYPERSILDTTKYSRIPYLVLPDVTIKMFKIKRPVVVVDVLKEAVYTIEPTPFMPRRRYQKKSTRTMSYKTYSCLGALIKQRKDPPKLVVFTTDDPEGVETMIEFYEAMPNINSIYCHRKWIDTAKVCGAVLFEQCCSTGM